ncbi:MAG: nickel pincer cofactor biosynthesis protein LarC [Actinomycetota bacterium]
MGKFLYIDCFSGISGDMMVAALMDLGIDIEILRAELGKLDIGGYQIEAKKVKRNNVAVHKFNVEIDEGQPLRNYGSIKKLIGASRLKEKVKGEAIEIFEIIARAESKVHGIGIDKVHFHEIGAVDSIIDILATVICIDKLEIRKIYSKSIPTGKGFTKSMHGTIPVPAPATLEILKGIPVYGGDFDFEVTTPTGAAIVKKYVIKFCDLPEMSIVKIGMGTGNNMGKNYPNILRLVYGNLKACGGENLSLLSTNIDDCSSEIMGYVLGKLFKLGVNDAWIENIIMKKNRPGFKLCIICPERIEEQVADLVFRQTTTFGIRTQKFRRHCLEREIQKAKLPYGQVEIKIGYFKGEAVTVEPEYDSCKKLAEKTGKPLKQVYQDAKFLFSSK